MIGRVFNGRYKLTERIGIGGMAEVYKAQDQVLGRVVAVKVMLPQYAADPEFTARFKQEAAAAANLQSPFIVNVYDWGQDEGTYYLVMEYVHGTDLKTAIKQRGCIPQRKTAEIGSQVCQALSVAHGQDIAHRDIKPQNIMIQPDGNVKVMDFGIARAKNSVMAKTSNVLGTAHYISPEQAQGKDTDGASDIYSLGCVLYEAVTGQLLFDGPEAVGVALRQVSEAPVPPSQIMPNISPELESIILKALEKKPQNRFQTAREMKHALDDFLMGRPVHLGDNTSAPTAVLHHNPHAFAGNIPSQTAVMPAIDGSKSAAAKHFTQDDSKSKKNKKPFAIILGILAVLATCAALGFVIFNASQPQVPDVTGQTKEAAVKAIESAGYVVGDVTEEYNSSTVAGRVCAQDPKGHTPLQKGSTVNLVISKGVEKGIVPDLDGLSAEQAEKAIKDAGYVAQYAGNEAANADKNTVSKQDPAAGQNADKGTTIKYWISTGPEDVSVPNVVGKKSTDARSILADAGLQVEITDGGYSNQYGEDVVMSQTPNGGKLSKGATVSLAISKGQDPSTVAVAVPNVVGMMLADASSKLEAAGFNVDSYPITSDKPKNTVISQSQTKAVKGANITLTVSNGNAG